MVTITDGAGRTLYTLDEFGNKTNILEYYLKQNTENIIENIIEYIFLVLFMFIIVLLLVT